jgi:CO/xanthine dehydrogenase Mo-binding subunit
MQDNEFYSDLTVPGMLCAKLIRAPKSGILKTIAPAPHLSDGIYFYTAKDIPGVNRVQTLETAAPVFAASKVSFKGEPVGIVAGENEDEVERAAAQVIVEIEPDPDSAGPPRKIFNRSFCSITGGKEPEPSGDELVHTENSYSISHTSGLLCEPAGCAASFIDGKLTVHCPAEWVSHLRENLSAALDIPASNIEIVKTRVTSHSSTSVWYSAVLACQAGLAAMLSGRAVKLALSRAEHARLLESPMNCVITHKSSVAQNGEIVSMDIEILADAGSGNPFAREIIDRLAVSAAGMYRPKRLSVNASIVSSDAPPACVFLPRIDYHCFFAAENHIQSIVPRVKGLPLDVRKINSTASRAQKNKSPFIFDLKISDAVLDTVASLSDFQRKYSAYEMQSTKRKAGNRQSFSEPVRGIGIAWAFAPAGFYGTALSETEQTVWDGGQFCGRPYHSTAPAAAVVEIELEPFTLRETVRGIWLAVDGGEIPAAKQAEAALSRAVQDMLSSFVLHGKLDPGKIAISFVQSQESPKQIGDAAYTVLPAAFAAALSQCASFPIRTLPIETDTVFRLITERGALEGDC